MHEQFVIKVYIVFYLSISRIPLQLCEFYKGRGEFHDAVLVSLATNDLYINDKKSKDVKGSDLRRDCIKETQHEKEPGERKNK